MDDPKTQKEHRYMVEEITVTPFFKSHRGHMPATIKLHAEVRQIGGDVVLETDVRGYGREDVEVSATVNSIDVSLKLEGESGDVRFHNSYFTPVQIDPSRIRVEHGSDGKLKVSASIR